MNTDKVIWSCVAVLFVICAIPIAVAALSALAWPLIAITSCLIAARLVWWWTSRY